MKRLFFFILITGLMVSAIAGPVDVQKAKTVAQNFWAAQAKTPATFIDVTAQTGCEGLYVFTTVDGNGFVLVAADDCAKPILGYSKTGMFNPTEVPPAVRAWLGFYEQQIQWAKSTQSYSAVTKQAWQELLTTVPSSPKYADTVAPLMTTTWSQRPWYNELCPVDSSLYSSHPTTGCTATGMAQVMKYWNYPRHGFSHYSYSWEGVQPYWNYGTLSADFENTEYDWENMPNGLDWSSTPEQIYAVAQLMSHVGISIQMSYNIYGEGSSDAPVALLEFADSMYLDHTYCPENALPKFFGYKASLRGLARAEYSDTEWDDMLREDISNGRPVLYGGFGIDPNTGASNGGHCFVLDGYDNNGLFHVNWGWGGSYDAYFPTSALDVIGYNFSDRQEAIFGIEPAYSYLEMSDYFQQLIALDSQSKNAYLSFAVINKGDSTFTGKIGIGIWDENEVFQGLLMQENVEIEPMGELIKTDCFSFLHNLETGKTYKAVLLYGDTLPEFPIFETDDFLNHTNMIVTNSAVPAYEEQAPIVFVQDHQIVIQDEKMSPITVYNVLGSVVYQNANPQTETQILMKTAGTYLLQIGHTTKKIVIP